MSSHNTENDERIEEALNLQNDEILALQAIYDDETITIDPKESDNQNLSFVMSISLENIKATIKVQIFYPQLYPLESSEVPVYQFLQITDTNIPTSHHDPLKPETSSVPLYYPERKLLITDEMAANINQMLTDLISESAGNVILFDWVSQVVEYLENEWPEPMDPIPMSTSSSNSIDDSKPQTRTKSQTNITTACAETEEIHNRDEDAELASGLKYFTGPRIVDRRSVFVAHVISGLQDDSKDTQRGILRFLMRNNKVAKATHNIMAYRVTLPSGVISQDCDDDGETAAGGRLLHLLQLLDVTNVMVVVSRWYGGFKLGSDRFKHINNAARKALKVSGHVEKVKHGPRKKDKHNNAPFKYKK